MTCKYNLKHNCVRNSSDSSFLCDSTLRRGCVIVHNRDCVLSHDPRTRLLRMNIVNILLNLASPPWQTCERPTSPRWSVSIFRFPWLSVTDGISHAVTRPPTTSRHPQEIQQIQARNKPTRGKKRANTGKKSRGNSPQIQTWRGGSWHIVEQVNLVGSHGKSKKSTYTLAWTQFIGQMGFLTHHILTFPTNNNYQTNPNNHSLRIIIYCVIFRLVFHKQGSWNRWQNPSLLTVESREGCCW